MTYLYEGILPASDKPLRRFNENIRDRDLHLSKQDKPTDIFGREWIDHSRKIKEAWLRLVANDDVVLIPGDISWAMGLEDAYEDLADILTLPGEKIFIRAITIIGGRHIVK